MSQRIVCLDILRVLAVFAVVLLHVACKEYYSAYISYKWFVSVVEYSLVCWAVPVFVMISGTLFLSPQKQVPVGMLLRKYESRLLFAYVFWSLCYSALSIADEAIHTGTFAIRLSSLMPHYHLWFLPMLMGVYCLIPLLRKITEEDTLVRYALVLWFCYIVGNFLLMRRGLLISVFFNIRVIIGYSGYFLLGHFMSKAEWSARQRRTIYMLGLVGLLVTMGGAICYSMYKGYGCKNFQEPLSPHVVLMAAALFLWVKENSTRLDAAVGSFVRRVRDDAFGIYLVHSFWLYLINTDRLRNVCNQAVSLPIIAVAVFLLSLFTTKLIRKIPYLRKAVC